MSSSPPRIINLLLDLSGTLHIGDIKTPSALEALSKLRSAALLLNKRHPGTFRLRFCSNTSKESSTDLLSRLHKIGFSDIKQSELFTSLDACARICASSNLKPLLLLSTSATLSPSFQALNGSFSPHVNITVASNKTGESQIKSPSKLSEEDQRILRSCNSVVIGLEPRLMTYDWLNEAFRILSNEYGNLEKDQEQGRLIATHRASYFRPSTNEPLSLGPGPFVSALETSIGSSDSTTVCGKPTRRFFEACMEDMDKEFQKINDGSRERRNIIVGDDVEQDLGGGAVELGLERILVRTGKYRSGDEKKSKIPLEGIFETLSDFIDSLMKEKDFEGI